MLELEQFPVLDPNEGLKGTNDDLTLLFESLENLATNVIPTNIPLLQDAYTQKDWDKIKDLAHLIKSGAVYLGTIRLKYSCQYLEQYFKKGHTTLLDELYHQLIQVAEETRKKALNWLNRYNPK